MTKIVLFKFFLIFSLVFFQTSCKDESSNSETKHKLPNPITIKGMKLGLDYESQIKIGEQNGLCKSEYKSSRCHYNLTKLIMAEPLLKYGLFNDEKVLALVEITLFSPFNFPTLVDENGNETEYPSLTLAEIQEVKSMYTVKYGKPNEDKWEYGGSAKWTINGEMQVTLTYTTTEYAYGFQIHPQIKWAFIDDAFRTKVIYEFSENYKKLLKEDPNINGEPIGDKI